MFVETEVDGSKRSINVLQIESYWPVVLNGGKTTGLTTVRGCNLYVNEPYEIFDAKVRSAFDAR